MNESFELSFFQLWKKIRFGKPDFVELVPPREVRLLLEFNSDAWFFEARRRRSCSSKSRKTS